MCQTEKVDELLCVLSWVTTSKMTKSQVTVKLFYFFAQYSRIVQSALLIDVSPAVTLLKMPLASVNEWMNEDSLLHVPPRQT